MTKAGAALALIGLTLCVAAVPARGQAQADAPPPVPSSYEWQRVETLARQAETQRALEARRQSRQIEYTGAGDAAGSDTGTGFSLDISARQTGALAITGVIGLAAARALSEGTQPDPLGRGGGGSGGGTATGTR